MLCLIGALLKTYGPYLRANQERHTMTNLFFCVATHFFSLGWTNEYPYEETIKSHEEDYVHPLYTYRVTLEVG